MKRLKRKADLEQTYKGYDEWATMQELLDAINELESKEAGELVQEGYRIEFYEKFADVMSDMQNGEKIQDALINMNQSILFSHANYIDAMNYKDKLKNLLSQEMSKRQT